MPFMPLMTCCTLNFEGMIYKFCQVSISSAPIFVTLMRHNRSQVELDKRYAADVNSTENRSPEMELKELSGRQYLVEHDK